MAFNDITNTLAQYKETIGLIITGLAGSVTHILNKAKKGEKLTFKQHLIHLFISGFVGYMTYLLLEEIGITGNMQGFIIGICTYSAIQIIDALDMLDSSIIIKIFITLYNLGIDFLKHKLGVGKK